MSGIMMILAATGASGPPPGQQAYTSPGTYTWVAPALVTSVSVVAVGGGGGGGGQSPGATSGTASYFINSGTLQAGPGLNNDFDIATGGSPSGSLLSGGGSGGAGYARGGGGAGGYSGNGGANSGATQPGVAGAGGGGGSGTYAAYGAACSGGGGVGLLGQGANGAGGVFISTNLCSGGDGGSGGGAGGYGYAGYQAPGQGGDGGTYGGGGGAGGSSRTCGSGAALAYGNNISVTPGSSYTVVVGSGGLGGSLGPNYYNGAPGAGGAVRIIWPGNTRSFPSTNTGNL